MESCAIQTPAHEQMEIQSRKKSVQFNQSVRCKAFPRPTEDDDEKSWYNDCDYFKFKNQMKRDTKDAVQRLGVEFVLEQFQPGGPGDGNNCSSQEDFCSILGLDRCIPIRNEERKRRRFAALEVVMHSQEQNETVESIAQYCSEISIESVEDAYRMAVCSLTVVQSVEAENLATKNTSSVAKEIPNVSSEQSLPTHLHRRVLVSHAA